MDLTKAYFTAVLTVVVTVGIAIYVAATNGVSSPSIPSNAPMSAPQ